MVELLVVIAIIAILAALLLPVMGKVKQRAQSIQCMNNHRQLMVAWRMYSDDSREELLYASHSAFLNKRAETDSRVWVHGLMDFDTSNPSNWDPAQDIEKSPLWEYAGKQAALWRCPGDRSTIIPSVGPHAGKKLPRVRSVSMNLWVGGFGGEYPYDRRWKVYTKSDQLFDPGPANLWVLMDQREDSVNLGNFLTVMDGFDPKDPSQYAFCEDVPPSYHHKAAGLSFADGHADIQRWTDPRTMPPLRIGEGLPFWNPSPGNKDIEWLQFRSTRPVSP